MASGELPRIGITGGIAEGKTTVLGYLREMGIPTASADDIAAEVFANKATQAKIADVAELPMPLDRAQLRARIAEDPLARRNLNRLLHPLILERMRKDSAQFFEVPLLVETCLQREFDEIWVVTCGRAEQRRRLAERLGSDLEVVAALSTQLPTEVKLCFADVVLRTNQAEPTVKANVAEHIHRIFR